MTGTGKKAAFLRRCLFLWGLWGSLSLTIDPCRNGQLFRGLALAAQAAYLGPSLM
jgi:hypothetical protein